MGDHDLCWPLHWVCNDVSLVNDEEFLEKQFRWEKLYSGKIDQIWMSARCLATNSFIATKTLTSRPTSVRHFIPGSSVKSTASFILANAAPLFEEEWNCCSYTARQYLSPIPDDPINPVEIEMERAQERFTAQKSNMGSRLSEIVNPPSIFLILD